MEIASSGFSELFNGKLDRNLRSMLTTKKQTGNELDSKVRVLCAHASGLFPGGKGNQDDDDEGENHTETTSQESHCSEHVTWTVRCCRN